MKQLFSFFAICLLLITGGCSDSSQDISTLVPQLDGGTLSKFVPFKGNMIGYSEGGGAASCDAGWNAIHGTLIGQVSHCGRSTNYFEHCALTTSTEGGLINNGFATITAANGDEIYTEYSGTFVFDTFPPTMITLDFAGTIVGGTGRFEGATGSVDISGTQDPTTVPPTVTVTWTGTIQY